MSKEKEKLSFVFPNIMAKMMKKIDMRAQLESSMISMSFIMVGMIIMVIYLIIYGQMGLFYKCLIVFNLLCGFIFISSFLVTTYHQYISFMEISGIDPDKHKEEIKKRGNIFKRIKLALKKKQNIELNPAPQLVHDAVENMIKIKQDELKDYQKLGVQADKLRKEDNNKQK
jgi:hypothetical protein